MQPEKLPENPEYAPQWSLRMRVAFILALIPLVPAAYLLIFGLGQYAGSVACLFQSYGMYDIMVGLPVLGALLCLTALGSSPWRAIHHRQYPPPGQKVWGSKVRYRYGRAALWMAVKSLLPVLLCLLLAAVGALYLHTHQGDKIHSDAAATRAQHCTHP